MSPDSRPADARRYHQEARQVAAFAQKQAHELRQRRNDLVRQLRESDPDTWTYSALAEAVGCSPELIAAIVKGRV
jgi:hypothetical protein